ncbi:MAG TPA: DUF3034 family protein [Acidiferrobacteraceae bacterium]|nr:DUF3034 family protein [Acidiferrobacteraceae bacterium]
MRATFRGALAFTAMCVCFGFSNAHADTGRLLATGGVTEVEGAAGGGIVPWALIAGYGTADQVGATAFYTTVSTGSFKLDAAGAAVGLYNRVELSVARQQFDLGAIGDLAYAPALGSTASNYQLAQNVYGVKVRLFGDAIYAQDSWVPQVSAGVQFKQNLNASLVKALGARSANGVDYYLAATKLLIGAAAGRDLLLNATVRATRANQLGLLGFGGDRNQGYRAEFEGSAAVLLRPDVILGAEYRQKPNNLSFAQENRWTDEFVAYVPNKNLSMTAAFAQLGSIAGVPNQNGPYLSVQASF